MSLINDLDLARAAIDTYGPDAVPTWNTDDVHAYLSHVDGCAVIAFEGSASLNDWARDFYALPVHELYEHADLGLTHKGLIDDVEEIFDQIMADLPLGPVAVCGHSKGGGEGQGFAAMLRARYPERNLIRLATFGAPCMGLMHGLLRSVPGNDYRNRRDPVPKVPTWLLHPRPVTSIDAAPEPDDPWGLLADHHSSLYVAGVAAFLGLPGALSAPTVSVSAAVAPISLTRGFPPPNFAPAAAGGVPSEEAH